MMVIADRATYQAHRAARDGGFSAGTALHEWVFPILLLGGMGAMTWAIRGTDGWSGKAGTVVPGMTWGLLWYYLCRRKGIDARGIALWLGLGIVLGGDFGYGQYVSWIQGHFMVRDEIIPVAPWIGYIWFVIAGAAWGAPGGILLGWALRGKASVWQWVTRIAVPIAAGFLAWWLVKTCPGWFFPNYGQGIYAGELGKHLQRTVDTNTENFIVVAWWLATVLVAVFQRDRATTTAGLVVGGGFGIGFCLAAVWTLGFHYAPGYIDWWKMWELNAGFFLGLLYVIVLHWAMRQIDRAHRSDGTPLEASSEGLTRRDWCNLRQGLSLALAVSVLLYITVRGASYRAGVLLGLYETADVGQYEWPGSRTLLFAPFAAAIVGVGLFQAGRLLREHRDPAGPRPAEAMLPARVADLMTFLGVIGAITIWPAKIGVLYALSLCLALFAYHRLNRRFDEIDAETAPTPPGQAVG